MSISFSPPDITQEEINEVVDTLKSGWITTGPKTKALEEEVKNYTESAGAVCLNSATAGMEMVLRLFEIGPGDEVITTPYTYSATAAVIVHTGATIIFADVIPGSFLIDPEQIKLKITDKTKAIIPVDVAGYPCNYDQIFKIVSNTNKFIPKPGTYQEKLGRILVLSDSAHSIGAYYKGIPIGNVADFTSFSFHAVKNVTTAEGGAVTFKELGLGSQTIYKELRTLSLHGQSRDALEKTKLGGWEYDILFPGYKCNMTDITASLGLVQLKRYRAELKNQREVMFQDYIDRLKQDTRFILPIYQDKETKSSCHLFQLRIESFTEEKRNNLITLMASKGIPLNVHYKPLPMLTCYKKMGFDIKNYPNAYNQYQNQVTLPLHTLLKPEDIELITTTLLSN
ncbi:MAG: DegT/DnrJ/EryC1/StrS family aminotransferase [Spirochaetaceae bacterium]